MKDSKGIPAEMLQPLINSRYIVDEYSLDQFKRKTYLQANPAKDLMRPAGL